MMVLMIAREGTITPCQWAIWNKGHIEIVEIIILLHMMCIGLLNSNFIMQIGAITVVIPTSIRTALKICDAISITEIAPMYNSELIMLDTMLLASNKFLFMLFCFLRKKEKKQKKERIYSLFLLYRASL